MNRFDKFAQEWDASPRRIKTVENIYNAITEKIKFTPDIKVVDFGTGTGLLLALIQPHVKTITGLDNSQGMLNVLKEKASKNEINNILTILFDAEKDHLEENQFDLAVSSMTFHHIKNTERLLSEIFKSLKPGGKICIADIEKEDGTFHSEANEDNMHNGFDKREFDLLLKKTGFKNTNVSTIFEIDRHEKKYPVFLAYGEKI